jgi:hypothetical protein
MPTLLLRILVACLLCYIAGAVITPLLWGPVLVKRESQRGQVFIVNRDGTIPRSLLRGWMPPADIGAKPLSAIPRGLPRGGFITDVPYDLRL